LSSATPSTSTPQERLLLAAILISGHLPISKPRLEDFTPAAAQVWRAACELGEMGEDVNPVNVWRRDKQIDPVDLCEIVSSFPCDLPAKHVDLMALAFEGDVRRRREAT